MQSRKLHTHSKWIVEITKPSKISRWAWFFFIGQGFWGGEGEKVCQWGQVAWRSYAWASAVSEFLIIWHAKIMMREYSQVLIYANGILKWFLELVREQQKLLPPSTFFISLCSFKTHQKRLQNVTSLHHLPPRMIGC